jgi:hypothetical protein
MKNHNKENINEQPNENRPFTGGSMSNDDIGEILGRIEARQEFQDRQNAERFARIEAALGVKSETAVGEPSWLSRTWTNHKGKIITGTVVVLAASFGGYYYTHSSSRSK